MGCDLHLFVEVLTVNGWEFVQPEGKPDSCLESDWFLWRNYNLFGRLAGVRRHDVPTVLPENRGVPNDASPEYLKIVKGYGYDGHSNNWLTLNELTDYAWPPDYEVAYFVRDFVEPLQRFADERGLSGDSVRAVFFFDN
jgi:hypothetical protein